MAGIPTPKFPHARRTVAQSVGAFAVHVENWVFDSWLQHDQVVKTVSDNSTVIRLAGVSVMGPRR